MSKIQISMDYYPEGDMLSITFGAKGLKGRGYEMLYEVEEEKDEVIKIH